MKQTCACVFEGMHKVSINFCKLLKIMHFVLYAHASAVDSHICILLILGLTSYNYVPCLHLEEFHDAS